MRTVTGAGETVREALDSLGAVIRDAHVGAELKLVVTIRPARIKDYDNRVSVPGFEAQTELP